MLNLYFAERDEDGRLVIPPPVTPQRTHEERFIMAWRRRGVPLWRCKELWLAHLEEMKDDGRQSA